MTTFFMIIRQVVINFSRNLLLRDILNNFKSYSKKFVQGKQIETI